MENKNTTSVLIDGRVYNLSGIESEDYIQRVALYINNKLKDLRETSNGKSLNTRLLNILLSINIADDLYKEKEKTEQKDKEIEKLTNQIEFLSEQLDSFDEIKKDYEQKVEYLEEQVRICKKELDEYIDIFDNE